MALVLDGGDVSVLPPVDLLGELGIGWGEESVSLGALLGHDVAVHQRLVLRVEL